MQDTTIRYLNAGRRMGDFTTTYGPSFPVRSRGSELITVITAATTELETQGARQDAATLDIQQATVEKRAALAALLDLLRAINQTARGMEKLFPGIGGRFRMPRGSDQNYINRARAFIEEATPMTAEFTSRGLPDDFLTTLAAAIGALESAIDRQNNARNALAVATASVKAAQRQLIDAMREFSPIVRNTLRADPAALAAWQSASHVERSPKRARETTPPPPTSPASEK
jgi:hypothetical protein